MAIKTLKKRAEFQRVRGGGRWSAASFLLEGKARVDDLLHGPRFGFTVTKKLGGAVVRNRIKRRLRAALAELASEHAHPNYDYVVVARATSSEQVFAALRADLIKAFQRVNAGGQGNRRGSATARIAGPASKSDSKD